MPSTVIRDYAYDPARRVLTITFVSGEVYDYFDVPPEVHRGLQEAASRGRYFGAHIRDRFLFQKRPRDDEGDPPRDPQPALPRGPSSPRGFLSAALEPPQPRRRLEVRGRRTAPPRRPADADARR